MSVTTSFEFEFLCFENGVFLRHHPGRLSWNDKSKFLLQAWHLEIADDILNIQTYCCWLKSGVYQLRLVASPIICRGFIHLRWLGMGFQPSTVSLTWSEGNGSFHTCQLGVYISVLSQFQWAENYCHIFVGCWLPTPGQIEWVHIMYISHQTGSQKKGKLKRFKKCRIAGIGDILELPPTQ